MVRNNLGNQRSYKSNLYAFISPYQFVEKLKDSPCCRWKKPHFHKNNQIVNKVGKYATIGFSLSNRWRSLWKHYGSNSSHGMELDLKTMQMDSHSQGFLLNDLTNSSTKTGTYFFFQQKILGLLLYFKTPKVKILRKFIFLKIYFSTSYDQ